MRRLIMICLVLSVVAGGFAQKNSDKKQGDEKVSRREQERQDVMSLFESARERANKASRLFTEALQEAEKIDSKAKQKLETLDTAIASAKKSKRTNQTALRDVLRMRKTAAKHIDKRQYDQAEKLIASALEKISVVPIVDIKVKPLVFTPDNNGKNDLLEVYPEVRTAKGKTIKQFTLTFYKVQQDKAKKGGEMKTVTRYIPVRTITKKGKPFRVYRWDGKLDGGKDTVDSGSVYAAQLKVTDSADGVGESTRVKFRTGIFITQTSRGDIIDVSAIKFKYRSSDVDEEYIPVVKKVYDVLLNYPQASIIVEGHSDHRGGATNNHILSYRRAKSVGKILIKLGLEKDRVKWEGAGEVMPKTLVRSKIALNRRVVFILIYDKAAKQKYYNYRKKFKFSKEMDSKIKKDK